MDKAANSYEIEEIYQAYVVEGALERATGGESGVEFPIFPSRVFKERNFELKYPKYIKQTLIEFLSFQRRGSFYSGSSDHYRTFACSDRDVWSFFRI